MMRREIRTGVERAIMKEPAEEKYLLSSPDARLVVYADTGHVPYWEDPSRVAADIATFVRRLAA